MNSLAANWSVLSTRGRENPMFFSTLVESSALGATYFCYSERLLAAKHCKIYLLISVSLSLAISPPHCLSLTTLFCRPPTWFRCKRRVCVCQWRLAHNVWNWVNGTEHMETLCLMPIHPSPRAHPPHLSCHQHHHMVHTHTRSKVESLRNVLVFERKAYFFFVH